MLPRNIHYLPFRHELREETARFLDELGDSPFDLSPSNCKKIKKFFPIPQEQTILWADCEFDLRCSGIVCTDKGCFVKTNVGVFDSFRKTKREENGGKSTLFYFRWNEFSPSLFCEHNDNNCVLRVEPQCQKRFLDACLVFNDYLCEETRVLNDFDFARFSDYQSNEIGVIQGMSAMPNANLEFINTHINKCFC